MFLAEAARNAPPLRIAHYVTRLRMHLLHVGTGNWGTVERGSHMPSLIFLFLALALLGMCCHPHDIPAIEPEKNSALLRADKEYPASESYNTADLVGFAPELKRTDDID
jgi:hypothetical protein